MVVAVVVVRRNGSQWTNISTGLDGSGVMQIVADPTRGSHDAYAVTLDGVYSSATPSPGHGDLDEHHRQPVHDPRLGIQQFQPSKRPRSAT